MNIVFFGTSEFAMPALRAIINSRHRLLAVVTQPDRKKGRRLKITSPPTKVLALSKSIEVFQPQDASANEAVEHLKRLKSDLFVVISFGQILKKEVLSIPKFFSINLHGSLLPRYRGAAPTNWAIINGDKVTGITVIRMNERLDEGDIITAKEVEIEEGDTNITLSEKLSEVGARLVLDVLDSIDTGRDLDFKKQDDSRASYAPKLKKEDGLIDWGKAACDIHNKVRGLIPWPGAYTSYEGKILKIWRTRPDSLLAEKGSYPGEVMDVSKGKGIIVNTGAGTLTIENLQLEGKKVLDADSFVRGHKIGRGYRLGL